MQEIQADPWATDLNNDNEVLSATMNMLRLIYMEAKLSVGYHSHETVVTTATLVGGDVGFRHYSAHSAFEMTNLISNEMHKLFIKFLQESRGPLSLIIDGSTTKSNLHLMAVLIQVIEPVGPVCHFYKLINMGSRGDAQSIVDAMVNQFKLDNIWSIMKSRLKAITFDGANVSENIFQLPVLLLC